MSDRVPADEIETRVGARRHPTEHIVRLVSADQMVYALHPDACREKYDDLRECPYARATDAGIDPNRFPHDVPVYVFVGDGEMLPKYDWTGIAVGPDDEPIEWTTPG